ncbi:helix-turn-helix domain-containing protein [Rubrivirga marina]|uniref:HTH cro/C1-type domain-containing protein n=1 Tax=Rubrivirga marina TaxID=1196024 RepID=A0A271IZ14_9BACT|nr:helix-turn-helix transcriptional regulator [Rubrivirga marina]PAP76370.1 hypothetical protein BSZ37_07900 [Rubrivirga marina]
MTYRSNDAEVGRLARLLREELGLSLAETGARIGADRSNLSKAERGFPGFGSIARRALEELAVLREVEKGKGPEDVVRRRSRVRVVVQLPRVVDDLVDRLREPDRGARFLALREAFGREGIDVARDPDRPSAAAIGAHGTVDLDTLVVRLARADGARSLLAYQGPREPHRLHEHIDRFAERVLDLIPPQNRPH